MSVEVLVIVGILVVIGIAGIFFLLTFGKGNSNSQLQFQSASRTTKDPRASQQERRGAGGDVFKHVKANSAKAKTSSGKKDLRKKFMYAQWKMSTTIFYAMMATISIAAFSIVQIKCGLPLQIMSLLFGPVIMNAILNRAVYKRFAAFDKDYPGFLLSLVGLLKTGMDVMGALAATAEGLSDDSSVKKEVDTLLDRLRMGVPETQAIGAFAYDIDHEEIELFVQALLLSRSVGGTLSDTLDRLARQVRKRQYFRMSARAAIGLQRGSVWVIIGILFALMGYMYVFSPKFVTGGLQDELGWQVWQAGFIVILTGIHWINQVTKIRV